MPAEMLAEAAPEYDPPMQRPAYLDELQAVDVSAAALLSLACERGSSKATPESSDGSSNERFCEDCLGERSERVPQQLIADDVTGANERALLSLLSSPNICSRAWIWRQYDHQVQNNTALLPGADAAVIRIGDTGRGSTSTHGIAVSTDCNGRYCYLDPYTGAQIALAEGARNLACVGAEPAAITDCLNFGNPEKPEVFYTFAQAVKGLSEACTFAGIPVVSGNVSFYNESFGNAIYPTPVVGIVGVVQDVEKIATSSFKQAGDTIILVGETAEELGGSEYLKVAHNLVAGRPPALDLELEGDVQRVVRDAVRAGLLASAHDCSEGGIAVTLAESCLAGNVGATVVLDDDLPAVASLFSETQSRIVISVSEQNTPAVLDLLVQANVPYAVLGEAGGDSLIIAEKIELSLAQIAATYNTALENQVHQRQEGSK
jgi:phosphoribosylformylglycinamidine synthase